LQTFDGGEAGLAGVLATCREQTVRVSDGRLDVPSVPPYILASNLWWANRPGSTLFMPVADAAEECLGFLGLMIRHGVMVVDHDTGEPAGDLEPFTRSGLLDREKRLPIAELLSDVNDTLCLELAFIGHNIVLAMQAMGLGGLYFNGMDGLAALGANAADGVYEALCPPYYPDMHAAVEAFVKRKFGPDGAYDADTPGPWRESARVKTTVSPYDRDFVDCMSDVAQYIYDKYGKFPGTRSTIMLPGFVQAHHLDSAFYDEHYQAGAYLPSHAEHLAAWHHGEFG
jgi:hypothetical protein